MTQVQLLLENIGPSGAMPGMAPRVTFARIGNWPCVPRVGETVMMAYGWHESVGAVYWDLDGGARVLLGIGGEYGRWETIDALCVKAEVAGWTILREGLAVLSGAAGVQS